MDSSVTRNNLAELVNQFLSEGGQVENLPQKPASARKAKSASRSKKPQQKPTQGIEPISLNERARLPEVERCIVDGLILTEILQELRMARGSLLRIVEEYGLELPKVSKAKARLTDSQVVELIAAGEEAGKPRSRLCAGAKVCHRRATRLYRSHKGQTN